MSARHAAVWIDHHEAKVFHVKAESYDHTRIQAPSSHVHRHPTRTGEHTHPDDAKRFYHAVAKELEAAEEILIVGPGTAKLELIKHFHVHDRGLDPRVVGVETVDHPSDQQLVSYFRRYFGQPDRIR